MDDLRVQTADVTPEHRRHWSFRGWLHKPRERAPLSEFSSNMGAYVIFLVGAWIAAGAYIWAALTGHKNWAGHTSRIDSTSAALGFVVVALVMRWFAWLYLRLPVQG